MIKLKIQATLKGQWSMVKKMGTFLFLTSPNQQKNRNVPIILTFVICHLCFGICHSVLAQDDNNRLVTLSKEIIESKTNDSLRAPFEELSSLYYKDNKYSEFVDFLKSLVQKNQVATPFINYYIALTRFKQLKYLEESKFWDEYFAQGNNYREELTLDAKNAIDKTSQTEPINLYSRLLIWQFHKNQQDVFAEESLSGLMNAASEFAKGARDLKPIKDVADGLLAYEEKGKSRELYKIYAKAIASSEMKDDELLASASSFYQEGNLDLSETLYDAYIARILKSLPKEKSIPLLIDTAKKFSYKDQALNDPAYAEKLFKNIEELGGKKSFGQELMYLRAFNLEKSKDYTSAKDIYLDLIKYFTQSPHRDEAIFKAGIISTYIGADIKSGRQYFEQLAKEEKDLSPQAISSLYQLGLLSQWEEDYTKAKEFYNQLLNKAADNFADTVSSAKERLKEIEQGKPIDYNLKTFLDISLKQNSVFNMSKADLKSSAYRLNKGQEANFTASAYLPESGCMQVELQYLWSGDIGSMKPSSQNSKFNASYLSPGTKEINLVIVSSSGILDRSIDLVDVY